MSTLDSASSLPPGIEHPFLVCPENQLAYTATFGLATESRLPRGMIVTVFGPTGTGKSHLLREAARHYARRHSTARVAQITGLELADLIASTISNRSVEQFREDYATVNLLICDGLDEFPAHDSIQGHLQTLFDQLIENGGVILLAAPKPPGELHRLSSRLVNRCHEGVSAELGLPGATSRRKLLEHFATAYHFATPADVLGRLAGAFKVSGRELLSLLKRLREFGRVKQRPINLDLLEEMIHEELHDTDVPLSRIAQAVAGEFGISLQEMQSGSRARRSLISRQTAMLLAREISEAPLSEIGAFFGGRNHSTVVHACQRAQQLIEVDQEVASVVAQIRQLLATNRGRRSRKPDGRASANTTRAG